MPRSALPQNYIKIPGILHADFEDASEWEATGGTKEADTAHFLTGAQSLKIYRSTSSATVRKTVTPVSLVGTDIDTIRLGVYLHTPISTLGGISLSLSSQASDTNRLQCSLTGSVSRTIFRQGNWVYWHLIPSDFSVVGSGVTWDTIYSTGIARVRISVTTQIDGTETAISLDDLRIGARSIPRVLITFDDGYKNTIAEGVTAYNYMLDRGIRGTFNTVRSSVGMDADHAPLADLQALYAQGFAIANHSDTHGAWANEIISTQAEYEAEIAACSDYLIANGMPRAARFMSYPGDVYNANALAAMASQGMLAGREGGEYFQSTPVEASNLYYLKARLVGRLVALATIKGWIDEAIEKGLTLILIFHKIIETPVTDTQTSIADFCEVINYLVAKKAHCVTIDEWYKGLIDPRYSSAS